MNEQNAPVTISRDVGVPFPRLLPCSWRLTDKLAIAAQHRAHHFRYLEGNVTFGEIREFHKIAGAAPRLPHPPKALA